MALDITKLIRIMRMTEAANDGEALNSVRLANQMLAREGKTWEDVINLPLPRSNAFTIEVGKRRRGTGNTARYGKRASQKQHDDGLRHTDAVIPEILEELGKSRHDVSTLMLLAGIRDDWERKKYLTTPQFEAIKRMFTGANTGGGKWRF